MAALPSRYRQSPVYPATGQLQLDAVRRALAFGASVLGIVGVLTGAALLGAGEDVAASALSRVGERLERGLSGAIGADERIVFSPVHRLR